MLQKQRETRVNIYDLNIVHVPVKTPTTAASDLREADSMNSCPGFSVLWFAMQNTNNKFLKPGNRRAGCYFLMHITVLFYIACQKSEKVDIYFMLALFQRILVHLTSLNWVDSISEINIYLKVINTDLCSQLG